MSKIVIVDDNQEKIGYTKSWLELFGIFKEEIIEIGSCPKDLKWKEYIPVAIEEIKKESGNVILLLDWTLYEEEDDDDNENAKELFKNLMRDVLQKGDVIICNAGFYNEQMREYKRLLVDTEEEREKIGLIDNTEKIEIPGGILLVMINHSSNRGEQEIILKEVIGYSEQGEEADLETSRGEAEKE